MNAWNKFWNWYENKILGSVVLIAIIQFIQVPHMIWNADIMLEAGIISRIHPVIDWFLYGVDLIEIISIINVGMIMFSLIKKKRAVKNSSSIKIKNKKSIFCIPNYTLREWDFYSIIIQSFFNNLE